MPWSSDARTKPGGEAEGLVRWAQLFFGLTGRRNLVVQLLRVRLRVQQAGGGGGGHDLKHKQYRRRLLDVALQVMGSLGAFD